MARNYKVDPSRNGERPPTETDLQADAAGPTVRDPFLSDSNLGMGNYSEGEQWQQTDSFRKGLFADAAFARLIFERSVHETKVKLARSAWDHMNPEARPGDVDSRREYVDVYADRVWDGLGDAEDDSKLDPREAKLAAIQEYAGISEEWVPPFWRMLKFRHEASRSRGARLMDNLFHRVQEYRGVPPGKKGAKARQELESK